MKQIKKAIDNIALFFTTIDYPVLYKSFQEVLWLTFIAVLPLLINILIGALQAGNFIEPMKTKVIPGEMLSYCLSFLAPSLYLVIKSQGTSYKLPLLHAFSIITQLAYIASLVLYLIAKNKWVPEINLEKHEFDLYYKLTLVFLLTAISFRIYSVYHGKNMGTWAETRRQQQKSFNATFSESIKG